MDDNFIQLPAFLLTFVQFNNATVSSFWAGKSSSWQTYKISSPDMASFATHDADAAHKPAPTDRVNPRLRVAIDLLWFFYITCKFNKTKCAIEIMRREEKNA